LTVFFHYSLYGFSNVYLVANDHTKEAIIIDPAEFSINLLNFIEKRDYDIKAVLVTHNHLHHIKGLRTLLKIYSAMVFGSNSIPFTSNHTIVHDGDQFTTCGLKVQILSVPGHSPDSVIFKIEKLLFTGDTLQAGLLGKTNSKYGNSLLKDQLMKKIMSQPDDCIVLPGHGPPSSIGAERSFNIGLLEKAMNVEQERYNLFLQ